MDEVKTDTWLDSAIEECTYSITLRCLSENLLPRLTELRIARARLAVLEAVVKAATDVINGYDGQLHVCEDPEDGCAESWHERIVELRTTLAAALAEYEGYLMHRLTDEELRILAASKKPVVVLLAAELTALRAVVEKLPKTADGVPVTPEMETYLPAFYYGNGVKSHTVSWFTRFDAPNRFIEVGPCMSKHYSTREAAEKARGGK